MLVVFLRTNKFASFVASQAGVADSFANARRMVRTSGKKIAFGRQLPPQYKRGKTRNNRVSKIAKYLR